MSFARKLKRAQQTKSKDLVSESNPNEPNHPTPPWIIRGNNITQEQVKLLRGTKISIGLPMYGGLCTGTFACALVDLAILCEKVGIDLRINTLMNESLIQRGRNALTHKFIQSDSEFFMFIDVDISFRALNVLELIMAAKITKQHLVGATYSKKAINWTAAKQAIQKGVLDQFIPHCAGDHVVIPKNADANQEFQTLNYYELIPVTYLGTGFMLMTRDLITNMSKMVKPYKNNHIPDVPMGDPVYPIFDCEVRDDIYLSEDYLFCARAQDLGVTPQMALWIQLIHFGNYAFDGCFMCTQGGYIHNIFPPKPVENKSIDLEPKKEDTELKEVKSEENSN